MRGARRRSRRIRPRAARKLIRVRSEESGRYKTKLAPMPNNGRALNSLSTTAITMAPRFFAERRKRDHKFLRALVGAIIDYDGVEVPALDQFQSPRKRRRVLGGHPHLRED